MRNFLAILLDMVCDIPSNYVSITFFFIMLLNGSYCSVSVLNAKLSKDIIRGNQDLLFLNRKIKQTSKEKGKLVTLVSLLLMVLIFQSLTVL